MKGRGLRWEEDAPKSRRESRRVRHRKKRRGTRRLVEYGVILLVAFVVVFGVLRPFIVKSFWIPSESMVPTLEIGDRIFVNRFIYRFFEPERGDIVVFDSLETDDELVKRVIGAPGDRVAIINGVLHVNGEPQEEAYVRDGLPLDEGVYSRTRLSEGEVFAMGDNRANSRDSRFFGPVPIENIEGEAFVIFWPPWRIGLL